MQPNHRRRQSFSFDPAQRVPFPRGAVFLTLSYPYVCVAPVLRIIRTPAHGWASPNIVQDQPKKVAVIGAGYIAVELAGVFQSLGTDTTLLVRRDTPLRSFDSLLVETLMSEMDKSGLKLKPHATTKVRENRYIYTYSMPSLILVEFADGIVTDALMVYAGHCVPALQAGARANKHSTLSLAVLP